MNTVEPQSIRTLAYQASAAIARCWPLRTFIYRNPLQGFEQLPFDEAVRQGKRLFGGRGYLPNDTYRALARAGRISDGAIREAVARAGLLDGFPPRSRSALHALKRSRSSASIFSTASPRSTTPSSIG